MPHCSKEEVVMNEVNESFLACCAPLSRVFSHHLFTYFVKHASVDLRQGYEQAFCRMLFQARRQIFTMTAAHDDVSTDLFLNMVQRQNDQVIQPQTLSAWSKAHLVRKGFNKIEYHSFAEVLLARMIDTRNKGWLPSSVSPDEPQMWVFYQGPPLLYVDGEWVDQPIQIVPHPLPNDLSLARAGIFWSPWEGLVRDGWTHIKNMGAVRFGGVKNFYGRLFWDITPDDLSKWGIEQKGTGLENLEQSDEVLQIRAQQGLLEIGMLKLSALINI